MFIGMIKTIRKVGDSSGIIFPAKEIKALGINEKDPVSVIIDNGAIKLFPLKRNPQIEEINIKTDDLIKRYRKTLDLLAQR